MKRKIAMPRFNDRRIYLNRNIPDEIFYFNAGGITYPDKNYYIPEHFFRHYSVQYVLSGSGFIEYNGQRYEISAGDMFYLNAVKGIGYGTNSDNPFTKIWVNGSGIFWQKTMEIFSFDKPFEIIPANDSVMEYFHKILDVAVQSENNREIGMAPITALYNAMYEFKNGKVLPESSEPFCLDRELKRYVDLHLCDDNKLSEIAARFGISRRTVYSKFKNSFGVTPAEYIRDSRLSLAKQQLCREETSVAEIAERIGFSDVSYFCKVFKNKYGMTPQKFRVAEKK